MMRDTFSLLMAVLLVAGCLAGCSFDKTNTFDTTGSYQGDAIVSTGGSGSDDAGGVSYALPSAEVQLAGGDELTLAPGCALSLKQTSTESVQDNVNSQETDTNDTAYTFSVVAGQTCTLEVGGTSLTYDVTDGSVRVTSAGFVTLSVGGQETSGTSGPFVYQFDGTRP